MKLTNQLDARPILKKMECLSFASFVRVHRAAVRHATFACLLWFGSAVAVQAQPLSLSALLDNAAATYPSLQAARMEARASTQDVITAERQRWPTFSAVTESGPSTLRSYPSRSLQVEGTLWDFGRNSARISEAQALADTVQLKAYLHQQDLFLQIVSAWQAMVGARERTRAAEQTLERLLGYQGQMQRRVAVEASPRIDLELVNARLLQTEVELTTAKTSLQVATTRLEQLSGMERLSPRVRSVTPPPTLRETQAFADRVHQTDWSNVASEHAVVAKARAEVGQVRRRLDAKKAEALPQVFVRSFQPLGTIPTSNDTRMSTFIGLRYTPGAGFSNFSEAQATATRITSAEFAVQATQLEMQQTLQNDREEFVSARSRIAALEKSVSGSALVLDSYQRQFEAGRKTWLDLLNAVRELAQNQYALADSQAAMVGAMHRLQIRMGLDP